MIFTWSSSLVSFVCYIPDYDFTTHFGKTTALCSTFLYEHNVNVVNSKVKRNGKHGKTHLKNSVQHVKLQMHLCWVSTLSVSTLKLTYVPTNTMQSPSTVRVVWPLSSKVLVWLQSRELHSDISNIHAIRCGAVWFQSAVKQFGGSGPLETFYVFLLHDLISMTLIKGSGLLDVVEGLICLLKKQKKQTQTDYSQTHWLILPLEGNAILAT